MPTRVWTFEVEGKRHVVELEHGYWSGKRDIIIDGVPFEGGGKFIHMIADPGSVHHFDISGIPCVLQIKGRLLSFGYELYVGGKKVEST